jgi:hypothetical protein
MQAVVGVAGIHRHQSLRALEAAGVQVMAELQSAKMDSPPLQTLALEVEAEQVGGPLAAVTAAQAL